MRRISNNMFYVVLRILNSTKFNIECSHKNHLTTSINNCTQYKRTIDIGGWLTHALRSTKNEQNFDVQPILWYDVQEIWFDLIWNSPSLCNAMHYTVCNCYKGRLTQYSLLLEFSPMIHPILYIGLPTRICFLFYLYFLIALSKYLVLDTKKKNEKKKFHTSKNHCV